MAQEATFARRQKPSRQKQLDTEAEVKKLDDADEPDPTKAKMLPQPCGYKILIALPEVEETTEGGLYKSRQTKELEEVGSIIGIVLAMGPDCYKGDRFSEPYCQVGDCVMMRSYSGTRFTIYGKEFRLINDDTVEAIVDDPRGIAKR